MRKTEKDLKYKVIISDNIILDNGDGSTNNTWHITQMNDYVDLDEIIIDKEGLKKLYLAIGEILIK